MTPNERVQYILRFADTSLIYGQRLAEWCGHGPALEEDIALANSSLDYIGQATNLLRYAGEVEGLGKDEDQLAFHRDANEFRNYLITELPNGDYAFTIAREFLFSSWYQLFLEQWSLVQDEFLRGFALKSIKEVKYHRQHAADWVLRMGDGTEESHLRIQRAINELWEYTGELFEHDDLDQLALQSGIGVNNSVLHDRWKSEVGAILHEATVLIPSIEWTHSGGRTGRHTEHLGFILADMQFLQRAYPGAKW